MAPNTQKLRKIAIVGSRSVGRSHDTLDSEVATGRALESLVTDCVLRSGKSSLTVQFVDGHFVESYYPTIENTFSKVVKYRGQEYATEIIDTAGQVRREPPALQCAKLSDAGEVLRLLRLLLQRARTGQHRKL